MRARLTIVGQNFVSSPLPRVQMGTDGPVAVEGPRPNLSGARIRNVAVEPAGDRSFADFSRAEIWIGGDATLVGANLRGAILQTHGGHDIHGADATGLVLTDGLVAQLIADDATLVYARMRLVEAPGSSFKRANLRMASFFTNSPSRLTGASFLEADLFRANLSGAECREMGPTRGCDFTRAKLREANLQGLRCETGGPTPACDFTQADLPQRCAAVRARQAVRYGRREPTFAPATGASAFRGRSSSAFPSS